jgi:hypothetical protein
MRQMGEDLRQAQTGGRDGQQGQVGGETTSDAGRDPLGRPIGGYGSVGSNENLSLEGGDAASRARALLDEIRRRAGDLARPQLELDYLRRLLDQF